MALHIKQYLDRCRVAKIPEYSDFDTKIFLPKLGKSDDVISFQKYHNYIIKIARYIINPPENFNLNTNWNNGINPQSEYLLATPVNFLGKMIQFDCCGYDIHTNQSLQDVYSGLWLPEKSIEIIREEK